VNRARRLARLLRILAAIIAEPGLNPLELADRAGVSERTLRRDLAELRELGYEVAYTSGYEVQEKLDLEGRSRGKKSTPAEDAETELLKAVAHAMSSAGLWQSLDQGASAPRPQRVSKTNGSKPSPIVLLPSGDGDAEFIYAAGFAVETAVYIRYPEGDDVLFTSPLEVDRARAQSKVKQVLVDQEAYIKGAWAALAARKVQERGFEHVRVSPNLRSEYLEDLRGAGLEAEVDRQLFLAERRHKTAEEALAIEQAQHAAEAAVVEVVTELVRADIRDGVLWLEGRPLTSERLYARAQLLLGEKGFTCPEMIIAGSPESAMPHYRGEGPIKANAPVIIDIFPTSRSTHYNGDITRTVVIGEISDELKQMHAAVLQALDAGIETAGPGVPCRDVHHSVCTVLVDRGYGTTTPGYEGRDDAPKMNHSTGHGVGLDVHEEPKVRTSEAGPLREGDVITVEPGLYQMGLGGVRIEDTGMVTKDGFRNFTTLTRSLDPRDYLKTPVN
jgi:Xaa-Pro aminopeptidase